MRKQKLTKRKSARSLESSRFGFERLEKRELLAGDLFALVEDINPGIANSSPRNVAIVDEQPFFTAGTATGVTFFTIDNGDLNEVINIAFTGAQNQGDLNPAVVGSNVYFRAGNKLWALNADTSSVTSVFDAYSLSLTNPSDLDSVGSSLLFTAKDSSNVSSRYILRNSSVEKVTDAFPGADERNYNIYGTGTHGEVGYVAYFDGFSSTSQRIGVFDGQNGTVPITANYPTGFVDPRDFTVASNSLYLTARTPSTGRELFVLENNVVSIVEDFRPGTLGSSFSEFLTFQDQLYFAYNPSDSLYTAIMTVTNSSIEVVGDIPGGYFTNSLIPYGQDLYFVASTDAIAEEPYRLDLTTGEVELLADLEPGAQDSNTDFLFVSADKLYMRSLGCVPHDFGIELWTYGEEGTDLTVPAVTFVDSSETSIQFDVRATGHVRDAEVVLVRSDNLHFDADDEVLASTTITFSSNGSGFGVFDLDETDRMLDTSSPFYLVVVDPAEPGTGGQITEINELNNAKGILKVYNYLFVDFGLGFPIDPNLGVNALSGTVADLRDLAKGFDYTDPDIQSGINNSDIVRFESFTQSLFSNTIDFNQDGHVNSEDVDDIVLSIGTIVREMFLPFDLQLVSVASASFDEIGTVFELASSMPRRPTYSIISGTPSQGFLESIAGLAPDVDVTGGSGFYSLNNVDDTVFVFADTIFDATSTVFFGTEFAYMFASTLAHEVGHSFGLPHVNDSSSLFDSLSGQSIMRQTANNLVDGRRMNYFTRYPLELNESQFFAPIFGSSKVDQYQLLTYALGSSGIELVFGTGYRDTIRITPVGNQRLSISVKPALFSQEAYTYEVYANKISFLYSGDGNDTIELDNFPNGIAFGINGGSGRDTMQFSGTSGDDDIMFGLTNRILWDQNSIEEVLIKLGAGNDLLVVGGQYPATTKIYGEDGNDTIDLSGNLAGATVFGDLGNDTIFGSIFSDYLHGGDGADSIFGGNGNDVLHGGSGNDHLYGEGGEDRLLGDSGDDFVYGGDGNDRLDGGIGADSLFGESGDDILFGGLDFSADQLWGGLGADHFVCLAFDVIHDFEAGVDTKGRGGRGGR